MNPQHTLNQGDEPCALKCPLIDRGRRTCYRHMNATQASQVFEQQEYSPLKLLQTDRGGPIICHSHSEVIEPHNLLQDRWYFVNHTLSAVLFFFIVACLAQFPLLL